MSELYTEIQELLEQGMPVSKVANKLGVSEDWVFEVYIDLAERQEWDEPDGDY